MTNAPRTPRPARLAALVGLVALAACSSSPDKRVLQYLNTDGFGKRYVGNSFQDGTSRNLRTRRRPSSPSSSTLL